MAGKFDWATVARVALSDRIRVVVLLKTIETDIPPNSSIEVTGADRFALETTTLARLGRLLRKLQRVEKKA